MQVVGGGMQGRGGKPLRLLGALEPCGIPHTMCTFHSITEQLMCILRRTYKVLSPRNNAGLLKCPHGL